MADAPVLALVGAAISRLTDILKDIAPTLAGALGTVAGGPVAGAALIALSKHLLGRADATQPEVEAAVAALPPDKLVELRKIDDDFKIRMTELGYKPDELALEDRENARARDIEFIKLGRQNTRGDILAYGAIGLLALLILMIPASVIPTEGPTRDMFFVLITGVIGIVKDVFGFEFGSSKDSAVTRNALIEQTK